ncbi:MAG: hypothetical protein KKG00_14690 [Bacteroidetes bacterium]|nr:hypothetical protein [Bacteroidota bacterium]
MKKYISIALSLLTLGAFILALWQNVVNIPSYDDYAATLIFLKNHYYHSTDAIGKIRALFYPHGEHYIVTSRLSAAIAYTFTGSVNFTALVWYQNLYLLGVFVLILLIMREQGVSLFTVIIPVSLCLFSLSFWQVSLYYWGGVQYYTVFFFAILSLYCLNKADENSGFYFPLAILFVAMAILSFGNGILVLPLGFFLLAAQNKKKYLRIWTGFGVLAVLLFLSGQHSDFAHKPAFNPEWMARLLFTFLGSFLYVSPQSADWKYINIVVCMVAGMGVMYLWFRLLFNGYAFRNPLPYCLLSLPILTGILIALARFDSKAAGGIAPRYQFFSACIPVFLLLIFYENIKKSKKPVILPVIGLVAAVWGMSFTNNLREIDRFNGEIVQTFRQWQKNNTTPLVYYMPDSSYSDALAWALSTGTYTFPAAYQKLGEGPRVAKD